MVNRWLTLAAALALSALACSPTIHVPHVDTGPMETLTLDEALPEGDTPMSVTIRMGAGSLEVHGGAEGLLEGTVRYNVAEWRPTIERSATRLVVSQGTPDAGLTVGDEIINEWDLFLGPAPMDLRLEAGAYSGSLDLTGVPLTSLAIQDGASDSTVQFGEPNPVEMAELSYKTGASTVTLLGLGNARFERMVFDAGAGSYTLDFSGELTRAAEVDVRSGVSTVRIQVPSSTACQVIITGGLNDVTSIGDWGRSGDTFTLGADGPMLTIRVQMGLGSLTIVEE
jgi:hypothetical protein